MFTKTFTAAILLAAAGVSALPAGTPTLTERATETQPDRKITHTVVAGLGGLRFDPDNVVAEAGSIVEFHFLPLNHAVAQSSFGNPCEPLDGGFYSGFNFRTEEGQADNVFQIEVTDEKTPIWYYCPQQNGNHCQKGMVGVINQNFDNQDFSLRAHRELAAGTNVSVIPAVEQGGSVIANPNPLGGF